MGWLIVFAVIVLLALLPLGVSISYGFKGFLLQIILGFFHINIPLKKRKNSKERPSKKPTGKKTEPVKKELPEKDVGGNIMDFWPVVRLALDFLGELRKKIRINYLEMRFILAGGDPCDLAVKYGKAWSVLGNLVPHLEKIFIIKKRNLQIACNYLTNKTTVIAQLDLTITLGRILSLTVRYGIRGLRDWLKIKNKRKGGKIK